MLNSDYRLLFAEKAGKGKMHKQSAYILLFSVAVLVAIGMVMLFSAGAFASDGHGDQFSFLRRQGFWLGVGFVVALICAFVDYH